MIYIYKVSIVKLDTVCDRNHDNVIYITFQYA